MTITGYSGTPLARKLSLKDGMRVWWDGVPASVRSEIETESLTLLMLDAPKPPVDAAHIFVTERRRLAEQLNMLLPKLAANGQIWVSWPKRASKVDTDITEDVIREIALPLHLVDVKVCSVDPVWSGLKLVIRKECR